MDTVSRKIGAKLGRNTLPRHEPHDTWAGYGSGRPCAGCDAPIFRTELEHEMDFADDHRLHFHVACAHLWRVLKGELAGPS